MARPYEEIDHFRHGYSETLFYNADEKKIHKTLKCGKSDCGKVLKDPYVVGCGHRYCEACLQGMENSPEEKIDDKMCFPCMLDCENDDAAPFKTPNALHKTNHEKYQHCRIDFASKLKDVAAGRIIDKLPVQCPSKCALGPVALVDLKAHLKDCEIREIICTQCNGVVKFKELPDHINRNRRNHPIPFVDTASSR